MPDQLGVPELVLEPWLVGQRELLKKTHDLL